LLPEARVDAAAATGRLHAAGASSQTALLLSWYIPYLLASAELDEAAAWTTMLEQIAQRAGHPWRIADAAVFRASIRRAVEPAREPQAPQAPPEKNWLARWRRAALDLHSALLIPDLNEIERNVIEFAALGADASLAVRDGAEGLTALVAAYRHEPVDLPLPRHASLQNLGAAYASMEAVALGGSSVAASAWLRWSETIPEFIVTAVEWPVCRWRVTGLLRARAGDLRGARTDLRRAIEWADAHHYVFERGLARVQLAEVMAAGQTDGDRRMEQRLHDDGWSELRAIGVDPVPHAYAASRAATAGLGEHARPALSRREAEVLALLARGCTYKEAAGELGISWRTVQNLAYRAYQKLSADGRVEAIQVAREHGLI
jgi:DNA-binding CsgD family transcriptional regulator